MALDNGVSYQGVDINNYTFSSLLKQDLLENIIAYTTENDNKKSVDRVSEMEYNKVVSDVDLFIFCINDDIKMFFKEFKWRKQFENRLLRKTYRSIDVFSKLPT